MLNALIIMTLLYFPFIILYLIYFHNVHKKLLILLIKFFLHKEVKFLSVSIFRFLINLGAGVASVSVVGYYIPQESVEGIVLVQVGILGIIISIGSYYMERFIK